MIPEFLSLPDRRLAYQQRRAAPGRPGLVFLSGYASDMTGTKAEFLSECCEKADISFLRFDYRGHGQSSGDFMQCTIGDWFDDTCEIIDRLTEGPQILIGSSMGGWLGLMLAVKKSSQVKAFIGIAAGPDFTEDLIIPCMTPEQHAEMEQTGVLRFKTLPPAESLPVTKRLIEESRRHLLLRTPLRIACPVRLLQGMQDEDIPWKHALRIVDAAETDDVRLTLIKDSGHRLSRAQDLDLLWKTVGEFL